MITKKESGTIILAILFMSLIAVFNSNKIETERFVFFLGISAITIGLSVFSKKIIAYNLDIKLEHSIWKFQRYWFTQASHLKTPLPMGLILPLMLLIFSSGFFKLLTFLQFDAEALPSKAAKKYGRRRFSTLMEWDESLIIFWSTIIIFLIAFTAKSFGGEFLLTLSKFMFYYAAWNLIPFSKLDGMKLLMGSRHLYEFTLVITALAGFIILW